MNEYPKKLAAYFDTLSPEERPVREKLYQETLDLALEHKLQSPRFWAARQIMTGLNQGQIQHKIQKRMRRVLNVEPKATAQSTPPTRIERQSPTIKGR